ncbi:MAG: DUF4111 domain-containing protein [Caldilineaceae bacterium]|nr:DUF4111 domain-containing protein [Caldilineaceae bacterium]
MQPTAYAEVNRILDSLLSRLQQILGEKFTGLYLYGSLIMGDFDLAISDIDLLAVTSSALDDTELGDLHAMHQELAAENPKWDGRIEVAYLSLEALRTYRSHASTIAAISPGEPFHTKEAGKDWLVNWYIVREKGVTLFGPSPKTILDPIAKEEFVDIVRENAKAWAQRLDEFQTRGSQAYAILTLCRALYTSTHGEQLSKKQAALWAAQEFPQWSALIQNALWWREKSWEQDESVDHAATFPEAVRFVHFAIEQIAAT